ncbi:MAG: hypothetical protein KDK04_14020 [Candidatus Competibacteraceae bacterium]|nr:hypothetical protein [Bacteroidota bacterium]MCB1812817.1 hypothetical protein [Candidatus Competibacteraceae bacterium]
MATNSGKAIVMPEAKNEPVHYSSDSWATFQLCADCESLLNREYERYSIGVFRNSGQCAQKHDYGVTFSGINTQCLFGFLVAVLWRAASSTHPAYAKVILPEPWSEPIRKSLLNVQLIPSGIVSIKVSKLIDRSPKNGFSQENLKQLVMSPFFRRMRKGKYSFCLVFEGFFFELFFPALSVSQRNKQGFLKRNKRMFMAPYLNVFDIPEMVECMATGYGKFINGQVTFKN